MDISTDLQKEIEDTVNLAMQTWNVPVGGGAIFELRLA